ncbi:hypothetical protein E4U43_001797 [Claviceps pusilla]|uniref:Alpha/beta hydrolase fold-3 domain-containing protein n=1 Tax=Claviceps pusilla TaxID=123648 RepID=A0A9P7N9N1_9HYPO|nr:hypothetical protein E4U43_001797 [Claviceps pusilla]
MHDASSLTDPLLVHLPPFPGQDIVPQLPPFLHDLPVASIKYRWSPYSDPSSNVNASTPLHWPTPVHDASFAMAWLLKNLSPPGTSRRDIYVYGSYLGASLATSLALTESHSHARFGVRGLIAYNGIFNWTMFLPDHRVNGLWGRAKEPRLPSTPFKDSHLHKIHENVPALFHKPDNLFDPFASPSLFFHCPGLVLPESFSMTEEDAALNDNITSDENMASTLVKAPRMSHLVFPPRHTTLKIPDTLIVYESGPPPAVGNADGKSSAKTTRRRTKSDGHSFRSQARELVGLMRRSVDMVELKERVKWDGPDIDSWAEEATRRVQMVDAGPDTGNMEPSDAAREIISSWIGDRV